MARLTFVTILASCAALSATLPPRTFIEDYCWRDFDGEIPADALQNGLDEKGKPVYIGQVLFESKLIPGEIREGDNKIYFEWREVEYSTGQNVKILCSEHADRFQWVKTRSNDVVLLTNKVLIIGGFEPNYSTYIGRVESNGVSHVGKVICSTDDCFGLYTTSNGKTQLYRDFQILTYNLDK